MRRNQSSALGHAVQALTTILLGIRFLSFPEYNAVNLAMDGIFGGITGWFAGIIGLAEQSHLKFNTWMSTGAFWLTHSLGMVIPYWGIWPENPSSFGANYYIIWGVWFMLISIPLIREDYLTFFSISLFGLTLLILGIGFAVDVQTVKKIAGVIAILDGLVSMYATTALQVNGAFMKRMMPYV